MIEKLKKILENHGPEFFGVCSFEDTLPLLDVQSKKRLPQNPKTVITMLFPYRAEVEKRNLSLYCISNDYHDIIIKRLRTLSEMLKKEFADFSFEAFCDISPIRETTAAYLAGLGVMGKNNLLINSKYGSFVFIGEIVTDMPLSDYSKPLGYCISCGKCIAACPTGALKPLKDREIFNLNTEVCLSALTQKKGELTDSQKAAIKDGGLVWGCDSCAIICPLNKGTKLTEDREFLQNLKPVLTKENLSDFKLRAYGYKGAEILKRNLCIIEGDEGKI